MSFKENVKKIVKVTKNVVKDGVESFRLSVEQIKRQEEMTKQRFEAREKALKKHREDRENRVAHVNDLFEKNDIVASYTSRSEYPVHVKSTVQESDDDGYLVPTTTYKDYVLPKMTVVGLVQRNGLKDYSLIVNYSVYNPFDKNYSAQLGYQAAVQNALEKKTSRNIVINNLHTEYNKEIFFAVADNLLNQEGSYHLASQYK